MGVEQLWNFALELLTWHGVGVESMPRKPRQPPFGIVTHCSLLGLNHQPSSW